MQPYPHNYSVDAIARTAGNVALSTADVPVLQTAPPVQFDGPGDQWSPETLLVAAAADCFVLTFRAIASASKLAWTALRCSAKGELNRLEDSTRFTQLKLHAQLTVPPGTDVDKARRLLEKAEKSCLITNSLKLTPQLTCDIQTARSEELAADLRGDESMASPS